MNTADISTADRIMANNLIEEARNLLGTEMAFGDRKVFLCALLGRIAGQDMIDIDRIRRAGLITCSRADLVSAMDPQLVADSEWRVDNFATFHFLVVS